MRHLLTSLALLGTFAAAGQTTNPFPYNPDVDADGWISVNDLLSLLAIFTTEFTPDSWETDSLSAAVVLNGNISYFECQRACHELEGHWRMADMDAFGKHWNLVAGENANHWVNSNSSLGSHDYNEFFEINGNGSIYSVNSGDLSLGKKCMCHLQSSPFVPDVLTSETAGLQEQIDSLNAQQAHLASLLGVTDSLSDNSIAQQYSIECVEMGGSPLCAQGIGWSPSVSLGPLDDGYSYHFRTTQSINDDYQNMGPLWRKFKLTGIDTIVGSAEVGFMVQSNGNTSIGTRTLSEENGEFFFYLYGSRSGCQSYSSYGYEPCCESEGIPLAIPIESAFNVKSTSVGGSSSSYSNVRIFVLADGYYKDTNIFIGIN